MARNSGTLIALSVNELLQEYVRSVRLLENRGHIGRQNRISRGQQRVLNELKSRADDTLRLLLPLRAHEDPVVQLSASILCKSLDPDSYREKMETLIKRGGAIAQRARESLRWDEWFKAHPFSPPKPVQLSEEHFWQTGSAIPTGISRPELESRIHAAFSGSLAATIVQSIRPAVGVWPRRPGTALPHSRSRLGGLPSIPSGWQWPTYQSEPLLFIGQINCAQLRKFANAASLPRDGVIGFFADYDAVHGCGGTKAAVFYWAADRPLEVAAEPIEDFHRLPGCDLAFYETFALPDQVSGQILGLELDRAQRHAYSDLSDSARRFGVTHPRFDSFHTSKLFGWPDLVQGDLEGLSSLTGESRSQLLLQIGWYESGCETESWGPGGILYYMISDQDLSERRFDRAWFEMQCT
jgi:uncharacterized protein YwqG